MEDLLLVGRLEASGALVTAPVDLLALAAEHVQPDPHAQPLSDGKMGYIVSSCYLDDVHLTGYTER